MGVQSDAPTCAHVNSSLVAQQIQLRTHAETGRAIARASGPSRDNQAGQAPLLHAPSSRAHHRRQDRESRAAGRLSDAPCTLPSAPDVFGRSCDKLCYGHVSGERCICAPNHFGYDCSLCAEADPARSLSQRVAAGEPAVLGSLPALAASAGAQRTSHGAQSGAGAGTLAGLSIPRGALAETVVVRLDVFPVEPLVGPEQAHLTPRAEIVQLRPHGLTFAEPITLHITTPAPQNLNDDELVVMYHDDDAQQWRAANGSAWSTRDGALLITAHTSHFSQWSVFSTPAPPSSTAPSLPAPPTPSAVAALSGKADDGGEDGGAGEALAALIGIILGGSIAVLSACMLCIVVYLVVQRRYAARHKAAAAQLKAARLNEEQQDARTMVSIDEAQRLLQKNTPSVLADYVYPGGGEVRDMDVHDVQAGRAKARARPPSPPTAELERELHQRRQRKEERRKAREKRRTVPPRERDEAEAHLQDLIRSSLHALTQHQAPSPGARAHLASIERASFPAQRPDPDRMSPGAEHGEPPPRHADSAAFRSADDEPANLGWEEEPEASPRYHPEDGPRYRDAEADAAMLEHAPLERAPLRQEESEASSRGSSGKRERRRHQRRAQPGSRSSEASVADSSSSHMRGRVAPKREAAAHSGPGRPSKAGARAKAASYTAPKSSYTAPKQQGPPLPLSASPLQRPEPPLEHPRHRWSGEPEPPHSGRHSRHEHAEEFRGWLGNLMGNGADARRHIALSVNYSSLDPPSPHMSAASPALRLAARPPPTLEIGASQEQMLLSRRESLQSLSSAATRLSR